MNMMQSGISSHNEMLSFEKFKDGVLHDYYVAWLSLEYLEMERRWLR